jgi:hypothetical protein
MKKKIAVLTLCATFLALGVSAQAQQPTKVPRIGYLAISSRSTSPTRIEAFRRGPFALCSLRFAFQSRRSSQ